MITKKLNDGKTLNQSSNNRGKTLNQSCKEIVGNNIKNQSTTNNINNKQRP